jgi:SHS2 domain-containing protein
MNSRAGYEEVNHTADRAIKVWAPDLAGLLEQAAFGMYAVLGVGPGSQGSIDRQVHYEDLEDESLVVSFLSDLLNFLECDKLVFSRIEAYVSGTQISIRLTGRKLRQVRIEIKAVTYHNLQVVQNTKGYETTIVFDV